MKFIATSTGLKSRIDSRLANIERNIPKSKFYINNAFLNVYAMVLPFPDAATKPTGPFMLSFQPAMGSL